jgi:hypothetical protein
MSFPALTPLYRVLGAKIGIKNEKRRMKGEKFSIGQ